MNFNYIEVNCEYEFSNQGGGFSEVFKVADSLDVFQIEALVYAHLVEHTRNSDLQDEDYAWSYVTLTEFIEE